MMSVDQTDLSAEDGAVPFLEPSLPPAFDFLPVPANADVVPRAAALAETGVDATGTLLLCTRPDRLDCALVLNPERPLEDALKVVCVAGVALNDALGSIIPPQIAVTFGWPDQIMINHALAGGFRIAAPEDSDMAATPDWIVLGLTLDILGHPSQDGAAGERTSLAHEGCVEIGPVLIVESFSRHFLSWVDRWQRDGFETVRDAWRGRADGLEEPIDFDRPGGRIKGRLMDLDDNGGLVVSRRGKRRTAPLRWILAGKSWDMDAAP